MKSNVCNGHRNINSNVGVIVAKSDENKQYFHWAHDCCTWKHTHESDLNSMQYIRIIILVHFLSVNLNLDDIRHTHTDCVDCVYISSLVKGKRIQYAKHMIALFRFILFFSFFFGDKKKSMENRNWIKNFCSISFYLQKDLKKK